MLNKRFFKENKKSQLVSSYMLYAAVIIIAVSAIIYINSIYKKGKEIAKENSNVLVEDLGGYVKAYEGNGLYKIRFKQEFFLKDYTDLELKIKDEEGKVICNCYFINNNDLLCQGNCSLD